ncbi:MAG: phosphate ABC transporter substrate-binding protein [Oscillospiraceae bacterium]|nr:phosphate ABC transporter substrate-binding protein [Oscillospiraceae bacterium]
MVLILFLCLLSSCANRRTDSVIVAGSTSVQPYAEILAEEYFAKYPDREVDVQGGGSSAGITAVESGAAHIGMSSRNLKESESHLWSIEIAKDGLAVIVNPGNPVDNLTRTELRDIYSALITNWGELGGPNANIHIITREEGSGTRSAYEELVMGDARITPRAIVQDSNGAVRQLVADDPYSIGFISLGLTGIGEKPVKAIHIDGVTATRENVINSSYPLYRSFLFIAKSTPEGQVGQFIDFVLSEEGQQILTNEGLITEGLLK